MFYGLKKCIHFQERHSLSFSIGAKRGGGRSLEQRVYCHGEDVLHKCPIKIEHICNI